MDHRSSMIFNFLAISIAILGWLACALADDTLTPRPIGLTECNSPPAGSYLEDSPCADLKNAIRPEVVDGSFEKIFKNRRNVITLMPQSRALTAYFFDLLNPMSHITPTYSIYTLIFEGTIIITPDDIDVILSLESATEIELIDTSGNFIASSLAHRAPEFKKLTNLKRLQISLPERSVYLNKYMQPFIKHSPSSLKTLVFATASVLTPVQLNELKDDSTYTGFNWNRKIEENTITFERDPRFNDNNDKNEKSQTANSEKPTNQLKNMGKTVINAAFNAYERLSSERKRMLDEKYMKKLDKKMKEFSNNKNEAESFVSQE